MVRWLRSIVAVCLGYATIVAGAIVFQELLFGGIAYADSPWPQLLVGGGLTALSAVAGGYLLALVAPVRPTLHAVPLVVWLGFETTYLYVIAVTGGPLWFDAVAGGSLMVGVLIGVAACRRFGPAASRNDTATPLPS